jgi:hypothetical protein
LVVGSGELVQTLIGGKLVDVFQLMIHPVQACVTRLGGRVNRPRQTLPYANVFEVGPKLGRLSYLEVGVEEEEPEGEPRQRVLGRCDPASLVAQRFDLHHRLPIRPPHLRGRGVDRGHHPVGRCRAERLALDERDGVEAVRQLVARAA